MRSLLFPCALAPLFVALAACGSDKAKVDLTLATDVDTALTPTTVVAGNTTSVQCTRRNAKGDLLEGGTYGLVVAPTSGIAADGLVLRPTAAGTFTIACVDLATNVVDLTPAPLVVTPGPAASTTAALAPATVPAGESAALTCRTLDAFGNPITAASMSAVISPLDSTTLTGTTSVSATAAGTYTVTCTSPGVSPEASGKATLTVIPSDRTMIQLTLTPERPAYGVDQFVTVGAVGIDRFGNATAEPVAIAGLDATPAGHHRLSGDPAVKIRFDTEGRYTLSAHAVDEPEQVASLPIVIDQTPPNLVIDSPARGTVIKDDTTITVSGHVTDNLGEVARLVIAGIEVPVSTETGSFSAEIPILYGVNLLDARATDPYGLETMVTRAVERSTQFYALTAPSLATDAVTNGVSFVLTQAFFDDGDHTEAQRDDLASLLEFIIKNMDFASLAPDPLTGFNCIGGQCTVRLDSITVGEVAVTFTLGSGTIQLHMELRDVTGVIALNFPCDTPIICPTRPVTVFPGTFTADTIALDGKLAIRVVNGAVEATLEDTDVSIQNMNLEIPDPTGLLNFGLSTVASAITGVLEVLVEQLIAEQIENTFASLFSALSINQEIPIPSPVAGQPANTLVLKTVPRGIDIAPERFQLRLDGLAHAKTPLRPHPHLGSIDHRGCAPAQALTFPPPAPLVLALHDDLINQLLFAVWDGGTTTLSLDPDASAGLLGSFGFDNATVQLDAHLPPVYDSCGADGITTKERVTIGDLWLDLNGTMGGSPLHIALWLSTQTTLTADIAPNAEGALAASLVIGDFNPLWVDVVTNEGFFEGDDDALRGLIRDALLPMLLDQFAGQLSFVLPSIDLSSLTTAVPAGTVINIDVQKVGRDNAFLTVEGGLK